MWYAGKGKLVRVVCVLAVWATAATGAWAQDLAITEGVQSLSFTRGSTTHTITRSPVSEGTALRAALEPACPPSCIQPMQAAPGVVTVGELEVMAFMSGPVSDGNGLLVDARLGDWFQRGTLPGAISMPYPALTPANDYMPDILQALGATPADQGWRFDEAFELLVFGHGAASDMAPRAITGLIGAGYPPSKLRWYRGGVTGWAELGLTITEPVE
jgi:rhodanese-related sulfurtransferase